MQTMYYDAYNYILNNPLTIENTGIYIFIILTAILVFNIFKFIYEEVIR